MNHLKDRTWAEVRLDNIEHNYKAIRQKLSRGCRFLAPVKANAYGHGAVEVSRMLSDLGTDYLAVACIEKAREIRDSGVSGPIIILGYTPPEHTRELIEKKITQTVYTYDLAKRYSHFAGNGKLKCHLKLDSGMGRLGFLCDEEGIKQASEVIELRGLEFEGVFTHFAVSDSWDDDYTALQAAKFKEAVKYLESVRGEKFEIVHSANSGAVINMPEMHMDMVRPGIALYGAYEESSPNLKDFDFKPGMTLKTRIAQIKTISSGDTVSYGRIYTAEGERKIAAVPIGYADGLFRGLSGKIDMLIDSKRAPQVGRICMDMCMIDVTDIKNLKIGSEVIVFGQDGDTEIKVSEYARIIDTISYELLCAISPRVPRIYIR